MLQALLYLYEIIVERNFDPQYSSITGEQLWLGGFHNLVHGKDLNNTITLGATLDFRDATADIWHDFLTTPEDWLLETNLHYGPDATADIISFELDISWDDFKHRAFVSRFECSSQGQTYLRFEVQAGKPDVAITHYAPLPHWYIDEAFELGNVFASGQWVSTPTEN
ncbi:hypothetical protein ACET87_20705 [Aeromonas veronii]